MADNYLEKQYETYLIRKAAWERAKKLGKQPAKCPTPSRTGTQAENQEDKEENR